MRIAVIGYGNIGKGVLWALQATPDMDIAGVVRRDPLPLDPAFSGIPVVSDISQLQDVQGVVLCNPSRQVPDLAEHYLSMGLCTVDSFDIHQGIAALQTRLQPLAAAHGAVSVISAGWDPGSDSIIRALFEAMAPQGITYTNFGPGMSMGHSVAVKAIEGVRDALSITIPTGQSIHRRMVYVELQEGYQLPDVAARIQADPYFAHDDTRVMQVPSVAAVMDVGHGVHLVRTGVSGIAHNQQFTFDMRINNPALTAQIMVSCMRAALRMQKAQRYGCYTTIELAPVDLLPGERAEWIQRLV